MASRAPEGLSRDEIRAALAESLAGRRLRKALVIPPDFTRFHSNAGFITNTCFHLLTAAGCAVDVLPALGTHAAMTRAECREMYGDVPYERFIVHNWRSDVVDLGEVPGHFLDEATEGLWNEPVRVEVNRLVVDDAYDLILSVGQVVPHEVIGMANHSKNLFVGVGGSEMINKSHMIGAVFGMERMMGRDHTPVRKMFDYALEHCLKGRPILFALTVTTAPGGEICTHGLFIGDTRRVLEEAVALSQQKNIDRVPRAFRKCVVYLDPKEFRSTWLGNKAVYRTRMAVADGGELLILAPGVARFGEDPQVDGLIRKYGYCGRLKVLEHFRANQDLRDNMGAAAHLIHGSPDGRFNVTYAVKAMPQGEMASVHFNTADYGEAVERYDPEKLEYGWNRMADGEEVYYIPNPALGLWIEGGRMGGDGPGLLR
jgi:nickel-dependent lactate racemase